MTALIFTAIFGFGFGFGFAANASPMLTAVCNVHETVGAATQTAAYRFDGSLQEKAVPLSLVRNAAVWLKGAPGAVSGRQAFYLATRIVDLKTGAKAIGEAYFVEDRAYSNAFASVVPGSHRTRLYFANGDLVDVWCFDWPPR